MVVLPHGYYMWVSMHRSFLLFAQIVFRRDAQNAHFVRSHARWPFCGDEPPGWSSAEDLSSGRLVKNTELLSPWASPRLQPNKEHGRVELVISSNKLIDLKLVHSRRFGVSKTHRSHDRMFSCQGESPRERLRFALGATLRQPCLQDWVWRFWCLSKLAT